jgi:DNA-binding transcriptional MerR regulator
MGITHPADELLTTASAARLAGVVPDTLRLWNRLGKIVPAFITPTGVRLYRRDQVERLVRERAARRDGGHADRQVAS